MSDDTSRELEDIRSRMRTIESTYRANDRQVQLQRLGQGPTPRQLGYEEPRDSRMGASSGFGTLGGVQPWHGQSNLLLDPTFESSFADGTFTTFTTVAGTVGEWSAFYVVNSGTAPTFGLLGSLFSRDDPNENPFSSAVAVVAAILPAGSARNFDFYVYPATDFSPGAIPRLPYLVAACRWVLDWSGTVDAAVTSTLGIQIVETSGPTIVSQSEMREAPLDEGQLQVWCSTDLAEDGDWQWRLKIHVEADLAGVETQVAIGIAEPQLHYAYTPDPIPFQPAIAAWSQEVPPEYTPTFATPAAVGAANAEGSADTLARSDHVHAGGGAITGALTLTGVISPPEMANGNENDWSPTGLSTCNVIRMTGYSGGTTLTGIAAQEAGRMILLLNLGGEVAIESESASSTATNRILCGGSGFEISVNEGALIWYDGTSSRWRVIWTLGSASAV